MTDTVSLVRLESFTFDSKFDGWDDQGYPVYDRAVGSAMFREALAKIFSSGVFPLPADGMRLVRGEGMALRVLPGAAVIDGGIGAVPPDGADLALGEAPLRGARTYAVFARLDDNDDRRSLYVRLAEAMGSEPPEPESVDGVVRELRLGYLRMPSNATSAEDGELVDERGTAACPFAAPFEEIDVSFVLDEARRKADLELDRFMAILQANLGLIESALDGSAAGNLQVQINQLALNKLDASKLDVRNLTTEPDGMLKLAAGAGDGKTIALGEGNALGVVRESLGPEHMRVNELRGALRDRLPVVLSREAKEVPVKIHCISSGVNRAYLHLRDDGSYVSVVTAYGGYANLVVYFYGTLADGTPLQAQQTVYVGTRNSDSSSGTSFNVMMRDGDDGSFTFEVAHGWYNSKLKSCSLSLFSVTASPDGVLSEAEEAPVFARTDIASMSPVVLSNQSYVSSSAADSHASQCWESDGNSLAMALFAHPFLGDDGRADYEYRTEFMVLTPDGVLAVDEGEAVPDYAVSCMLPSSRRAFGGCIDGPVAVSSLFDGDQSGNSSRYATVMRADFSAGSARFMKVDFDAFAPYAPSNTSHLRIAERMFGGGVLGYCEKLSTVLLCDGSYIQALMSLDFEAGTWAIERVAEYLVGVDDSGYASASVDAEGSMTVIDGGNIVMQKSVTKSNAIASRPAVFADLNALNATIVTSEALTEGAFTPVLNHLVGAWPSLRSCPQLLNGKLYLDGPPLMPRSLIANMMTSSYNPATYDVRIRYLDVAEIKEKL